MTLRPEIHEGRLILLMGVIQFINILDFMMVMPLGPDFALALGISPEHIGIIGGSYTLSAAACGLIASLFLDRFYRKRALLVALFGLIFATAMGAFAWNIHSLLFARVLAGAFGGPLSSLSVSMIADHVAPERRGAAIGKAAGGFAAAAVLGVPFGLNLALHFGWQAPFLAVALGAAIIWCFALRYLPRFGNTPQHDRVLARLMLILRNFKNPTALAAFGFMMLSTMTSFMIVPNISAHVQMNMHYPRARLDLLYLCGGTVSFFGMRLVGKLVDKTSAVFASMVATGLFICAVFFGFVWYGHGIPVLLIMICFMSASSARNVSGNTLASKVPAPSERGGFMSLMSVMMHIGSATGAFYASQFLVLGPNGTLVGIENVGMVSIALSCVVPVLFYITEKNLKKPS